MMNEQIVEVYEDWFMNTEKVYYRIKRPELRKLSMLNNIADYSVFNQINNLAYFLHSNDHKKLSEQYLDDMKAIVRSLDVMSSYFNAQIAFNTELSSYYTMPEGERKEWCWKELNQETISQLNEKSRKENAGFYSMIKEYYQYGKLKEFNNKKITTLLDKIEKFPYFRLCNTSKSDSEIIRFFELKYQVETNEALLKIGMQDLYRYFDENFSEYEPIDFCNEILEHIFKGSPMQKRYYTDTPDLTHTKITSNGHKISNIKKKV